MRRIRQNNAIAIAWLLLVTGCAELPPANNAAESTPVLRESDVVRAGDAQVLVSGSVAETATTQPPGSEAGNTPEYEMTLGTGSFINTAAARRNAKASPTSTGDVVLNFEDSDIREVVKTILGEMLGVNYAIDPTVQGKVSLSTSRPVGRDAIIPTLETLLRMNGAVLSQSDGIYSVVPESKAFGSSLAPQIGLAPDRGYQVLVVPLRYIGVAAMQSVFESLLPDSSVVAADAARNLLIIAGTRSELEQAQATASVFDVDQMQGKSVGLFRLRNAEASSIREELQVILGTDAEGPLKDMMQFVTISRLNALVVVSKQKRYLEDAKTWIQRLDRADEQAGTTMYVYPVQNGRAENLAALLNDLFRSESGSRSGPGGVGSGARSPSPMNAAITATSAARQAAASRPAAPAESATDSDIRIIADAENNALLIMASRADYLKVQAAIRRLDVLPLQVLVEATIIEVTLTDELSYGLQWFFKNGLGSDKNGAGELFPLTVDPSFRYTVTDSADNVRAVLNLLASDSRLDVVSSPSLMVLDNRTATIKVGDQVPVRTSETTSLSTSGADPLVTSTIQYRDTGVMLEVTPRVNPGGMVMLDITQDVNDVDLTTTSAIDSPTIIQRRITTSVAVKSGETVVLGGLIKDNDSESEAGVPVLRSIPGLGRVFSSSTTTTTRTELLVLITPTAIANLSDAREATEEMRRKMAGIELEL